MNGWRWFPLLLLASRAVADTPALMPLPPAPVRLLIEDVAAFDKALTGHYRAFLQGRPKPGDPVTTAWRQSQVGSKLEDQWLRLSKDLPLTWETLRQCQPKAIGLALLEVGQLEAVLVVDTPLAQAALALPKGTAKSHGGVAYALIAKGAADASDDKDRRMGLAWGRLGSRLILATSERALKLTIDEAQAGRGFQPTLPGFVAMELNLEQLRKDRYFRREFLFPEGPEKGMLRSALRLEGGRLLEVREGSFEARRGGFTFDVPAFAAAGWEPEGQAFWATFRRGLLEPIPAPLDQPVTALTALPKAQAEASEDRYAVNLTRPPLATGATPWEEGDLAPWQALLAQHPIRSWGYWVTADGVRRLGILWPQAQDAAFLERCLATVARRTGRASVVKALEAQEIRTGPGLSMLALRRTGPILWIAPSAQDLKEVPTPRAEDTLIRWAKVDLATVRKEASRWAKVEGPPRPEQVRPLSDRILGLLGWMPETRSLSLERRKTAEGWTETLTFGSGTP